MRGALFLVLALVVVGCDSQPPAQRGPTASVQRPVVARPLSGPTVRAQLFETDLKAETTLVVRDWATWVDVWRRLDTGPAPAVDFSKEMLLVASPGMGMWGRDVAIRVSADRSDSLVAIVHKRINVPNICALDGVRSPADVVRIPRDRRPVAFRWEVEELPCGPG